ncbi:MAG: hypothetical protein ACU0CT_04690 [Paracoccaceae bacterium]
MTVSEHNERHIEASGLDRMDHEALRAHSAACKLTKMDRRALADHIQGADAIGTGAYAMLARLLSKKLLYASVLKADEPCGAIARAGSRVTYAIDDLSSQEGRLFHGNAYALGQGGIPIASLLGATLIGMSSGSDAPFLQADGTFHKVRLISVDHQATQLYCET